MNESQNQRKRSKLVLPEPQVSEAELEQIVKFGQSSAIEDDDADAPTSTLLQSYEVATTTSHARTPQTPARQDTVLLEAQNIIALNKTTSVLEVGRYLLLLFCCCYLITI